MVNGRKEFFRVPLEEIEKAVKEYDKQYEAVDFNYNAEAEQFRESQRIQEKLGILDKKGENLWKN